MRKICGHAYKPSGQSENLQRGDRAILVVLLSVWHTSGAQDPEAEGDAAEDLL